MLPFPTATDELRERVERRIRSLPPFLDRRKLAQEFTEVFGTEYSYRTIEARPYVWKRVNGRALAQTRAAFEDEYKRVADSLEYQARKTA
jgi:hypothetical protein